MSKKKEKEKIELGDESRERTIYIIVAIILVLAIGIIVTWYFTHNKKEDNSNSDINVNDVIEEETEEPVTNTNTTTNTSTKKIVAVALSSEENDDYVFEIISPSVSAFGTMVAGNTVASVPSAWAKDVNGADIKATYIVSYLNSENQVNLIIVNEDGSFVVPLDAKKLIITYTATNSNAQTKSQTMEINVQQPVVNEYTVTFMNGAVEYDSQDVNENEMVIAPTIPTYSGVEPYTFGGWSLVDGSDEPFDFNTPISSDITLYAIFGYKVTFVSNLINVSDTIHYIKNGVPAVAPIIPTTTNNGYIFDNYYIEDETFITVWSSSTPITADLTIYGKWQKTININYDCTTNGGTGTPISEALILINNNPSTELTTNDGSVCTAPSGSVFTTWNTLSDGTGINVIPNQSTTFTEDTTLYAIYDTTANTYYSVTYDYATNGGSGISGITPNQLKENDSVDLTPIALIDDDTKEFVGWNTDQTATEKETSLVMGTNNITIYAIFKTKE